MEFLCELKGLHGVDLGPGYKNDHACVTFIEYTAREFQQQLIAYVSEFLADAGTDSGNTDSFLCCNRVQTAKYICMIDFSL